MICRHCKPSLALAFLGCIIPVLGFGNPSYQPAVKVVPTSDANTTYYAEQATVYMSSIVVDGHRVPMQVALQFLKMALNRPWSSSFKDRYKIVCRTPRIHGSSLHTLQCETNRDHFQQQNVTQHVLFNAITHSSNSHNLSVGGGMGIEIGAIPEVTQDHNNDVINVKALHRLLAKLPPAGSSYTLELKSHNLIVAEYIFRKGELVEIWYRSQGK